MAPARPQPQRPGRSLWPRTLVGQVAALVVVALSVSHVLLLGLYYRDRAEVMEVLDRNQPVARMAEAVLVLEQTPREERAMMLERLGSRRLRLELIQAPWPAATPGAWPMDREERALAADLALALGRRDESGIRVRLDAPQTADRTAAMPWPPARDPNPPEDRRARLIQVGVVLQEGPELIAAPPSFSAIRAASQGTAGDSAAGVAAERDRAPQVVGLRTAVRTDRFDWAWRLAGSISLGAALVTLALVVSLRRVVRPLLRLAGAAVRLGDGQPGAPLPETGPFEVRQTVAAFNAMQERLLRNMADRRRMLAALSHDLRSPITSLRLRAEMIDDEETRLRMLDTLQDMLAMADQVLALMREEESEEPSAFVDLAALLSSLAEDREELGQPVSYQGPDRLPVRFRRLAFKRAIQNLVDNALTYGEVARITLEVEGGWVRITIDDDGPGIPEEQLGSVFQPFTRLEASRSRATGGAGLGLTIARAVVVSHGGTLQLINRPGGGLRAEIRLPV